MYMRYLSPKNFGKYEYTLDLDTFKVANLLITFYLIFQANVRMATHALKTVITFIMKCMNVTAIEVMSSVTMVTAALVSFQFS